MTRIDLLEHEKAAMAAISNLQYLHDQHDGFRAWTEFVTEAEGPISGTWGAAQQAFELTDRSTFTDHSADIREVIPRARIWSICVPGQRHEDDNAWSGCF